MGQTLTSKREKNALVWFGQNWIFLFLLFLVILFSFVGRGFFSPKTLNNILISSSPALLLAAGEAFVIITGGIDLSVGFVRGLISVLSAIVMRDLYALGYSPAFAISVGIIVGLGVGLLPGLVNGILVAKFRVPPFIATLGMYGIANGFALRLSQGFPISFVPPQAREIGNGFIAYWFPGKGISFFAPPEGISGAEVRHIVGIIPYSILIAGVIIAVFSFILTRTQFGQHTYAIGGSIDAARRAGILVDRHLIKVYMISSFFAALAGVLSVLVFGNGAPTQFASSLELFAVAAVVIGGASLMGGKGSLTKTAVGVFILSVLEIGFLMAGVFPFYRYIAVGAVLVFAVIIDQVMPELVYE
ncbi:MAG: ribose transport system permease protein [Candidatus Atribacteria bacterium]|nr:ribose transport system permease protein [Candidatus Atribacteria bacterium]